MIYVLLQSNPIIEQCHIYETELLLQMPPQGSSVMVKPVGMSESTSNRFLASKYTAPARRHFLWPSNVPSCSMHLHLKNECIKRNRNERIRELTLGHINIYLEVQILTKGNKYIT